MGYWFPPSPKAFEPVARPLGYTLVNGMYVPDALDLPLLDMIAVTPLGRSIGAARAYDLLIRMRPPPDAGGSYYREEPIGGWGSKSIVMRRWVSGDLPDGGLPSDSVNPDGTVTTHYWDLADGSVPYRKCITRGTGPKGEPWARVAVWNPNTGWDDEGADLERDAVVHFGEIMNVIMILVRMVASATGAGAPAAMMLGIMFDGWKLASPQIQIAGWEPPTSPLDAGSVFMSLGGDFLGLAAEIGRTDAFGKLANEAQKTFVSLMTSAGAYPMIKGLGELGGTLMNVEKQSEKFLGGVASITGSKPPTLQFSADDAMKYGVELASGSPSASFGTIEVRSDSPYGTIQDESEANPLNLPAIDYRRRMFDAACVGYAMPDAILRVRRNAIWQYRLRSTPLSPSEMAVTARGISESSESALECGMAFDGFLSQTYANERMPPDPRFLADQAGDPQATATFRQMLARGKQSASTASDTSATMSFRQAFDKSGATALPPQAPPSDKKKLLWDAVAVGAVLYALSRVVK